MAWGARQQVEIFHLLFLRALFSRLTDRSLLAVKGGCNLRFFFRSPRYSEDLDLDARTIAPATLAAKIERIFSEVALKNVLAGHGVTLIRTSAPKQTEFVQRWKISLAGTDGTETPTKVEVSHRETEPGISEAVDDNVLDQYQLPKPILLTHYDAHATARQKLLALVGRETPQTRDVFDLNRLLGSGAELPSIRSAMRATAIERIYDFTYDDFQSQVVAYLEPSEQPVYDDPAVWEEIQLSVVSTVEAAPALEETPT